MQHTDVIIIGAGQAGLAISRSLQNRGIDHLVLERGSIGERWRSQRWDSLRLLTPNWMTRLPDWQYNGPDPDGFMTKYNVVDFLETYSQFSQAPVLCNTRVDGVRPSGVGYQVNTSRGTFYCRALVVATGWCDQAGIPKFATKLPDHINQITPGQYKRPEMLAKGATIIVGASATGLQLADEVHSTDRPVTLCAGKHIRMPRQYRGRDIMHWLDRSGTLDVSWTDVGDIIRSRKQPSLQLVGRQDRRDINLQTLQHKGVEVTGRVLDAGEKALHLAEDLGHSTANADKRLVSLLANLDKTIDALPGNAPGHNNKPSGMILHSKRNEISFRDENIANIIWCTGFRRDYSWLHLPIFDHQGEILHQGGVTPAPGVFAMGLQFMRRRKSSFLDGVGQDAKEISAWVDWHLQQQSKRAA